MNKTLLIILSIIAALTILLVGQYNGLVIAREKVNNQWAQVQTQYQRRFDLIPNLVETVKGVTKQEQSVYGEIADARTHYAGAKSPSDQVTAANQLESAVSRLLVITENYPELKSSESFLTLMSQLEGTENRISVERQRYNDAVRDYNLSIKRFPGSIFAGMFGFSERPYFQSTPTAEQPPAVKF